MDFNAEDFNGFFYTSDKQIRKMDDMLIIARIIEKYPDFSRMDDENTLKQVFSVIVSDTKFIHELMDDFDVNVKELFSIIYRRYSFIFNGCYTTKIQKLISGRAYAKQIGRASSGRRLRRGKSGAGKAVQVSRPGERQKVKKAVSA